MNTIKKRRSFEADHFRKFLLVVDETPEVDTALYYAASRMQRSSGTLVMLYVIVPQEFQHWINVRQQQVEEETTKAKALFRLMRRKLNLAGYENVACEEIIREGIEGRGDPQAHRRGRGHRGAGAGRLGRRLRAPVRWSRRWRRAAPWAAFRSQSPSCPARWPWRKSAAWTKRAARLSKSGSRSHYLRAILI